MSVRRLLFLLGLMVSCGYIFDNLVWIHPFPPRALSIFLGVVASMMTIWTAPKFRLRMVGACIALATVLATLFHLYSWHNFDHKLREYAALVSNMNSVRIKMGAYYNLHQNITLTNVSGYIMAGVLDKADKQFLDKTSATVQPQSSHRDWGLEIWAEGKRYKMSQDGHVTLINPTVSNATNDGTPAEAVQARGPKTNGSDTNNGTQ